MIPLIKQLGNLIRVKIKNGKIIIEDGHLRIQALKRLDNKNVTWTNNMNICRNCKQHEAIYPLSGSNGKPELCGQCRVKLYGININNPVTTVGELFDALAQFPRNTLIMATWEGIFRQIYLAEDLKDNTLLLDVDRN